MILYSISSVTNKQTKNPLWILVTFIAMFKPKEIVSSSGNDKKSIWMWIAIVFSLAMFCIWIYLQLQLQAAVGYWFIYSLITQWCFSVSSICVIWVFHLNFTSVRKITKPSVMFLQNGVLILNWKENKEAGAICFEIRTPRKKNIKSKELLCKVPSKIGSYFIMEKIVNNSEYHHREMRLIYKCQYEINY